MWRRSYVITTDDGMGLATKRERERQVTLETMNDQGLIGVEMKSCVSMVFPFTYQANDR